MSMNPRGSLDPDLRYSDSVPGPGRLTGRNRPADAPPDQGCVFSTACFWEPTLGTREGKALILNPLRRLVATEILKAHGQTPVTRFNYGADHMIISHALVPEVEQTIMEMAKEIDAQRGLIQGPEPDGACLSVYFKGEEELAERIAGELNIEVTTSIRGLKYIHYGWESKIRNVIDRRKLNPDFIS